MSVVTICDSGSAELTRVKVLPVSISGEALCGKENSTPTPRRERASHGFPDGYPKAFALTSPAALKQRNGNYEASPLPCLGLE